MGIGKRLRALLAEQGRTQRWAAKRIEMSETNFRRILDDKHAPSSDDLAELSKALGVSADYLLGLKKNQAG